MFFQTMFRIAVFYGSALTLLIAFTELSQGAAPAPTLALDNLGNLVRHIGTSELLI
jgi:hypothetical protein